MIDNTSERTDCPSVSSSPTLSNTYAVHGLYLGGKPILDDETREKIASGQVGRFLRELSLKGCGDNVKEWWKLVRRLNVPWFRQQRTGEKCSRV